MEEITRRALMRKGAAGAAIGAAALTAPGVANANSPGISHGSEQIGEIYELQAAFHRAKSHQDIDLMVSLWAEDCTFTNSGALFSGKEAVRTFFLASGSWTHQRISFVPSFKDQIRVSGDTAFLYFECHDVDLASGAVMTVQRRDHTQRRRQVAVLADAFWLGRAALGRHDLL